MEENENFETTELRPSKKKCSLSIFCGKTSLLILMTCYALLGALIFKFLEGNTTQQMPVVDFQRSREDCLKELWIITERLNVLYEKNWTKLVTEQLKRFERSVVETAKNEGSLDLPGPKWTFAGSLLYSVTLLTTVGYGSLSPKTTVGKVAAILYAIFGVPLMLILLSLWGSMLADCFRKGYMKLCCSGDFRESRKKNVNNPNVEYHKAPESPKENRYKKNIIEDTASIQLLANTHNITPKHVNHNHRQDYFEHYEVPKRAILATVRPSRNRGRCRQQGQVRQILTDPMCPTHSQIHNHHQSSIKNSIVGISTEVHMEEEEDLENDIGNCVQHDTPSRIPLIWRPPDKNHTMETLHEPPSNASVPSLLVLSLFFSYVALGAFSFSKMSGWTFLDAVYFCFLALSTIGVGDDVPITTINSTEWQSQVQVCACCLYIFVGLIVVATCFSLVQEEVTIKCRQWAHSMGLGKHQ